MKISVIIPSFNGKHLLQKSLSKVLKVVKSIPQSEVIVIDNGSSDGTMQYLKEFSEIKGVHMDTNTGFSGACNEGARHAEGELLLFLNNDCYIEKEDLQKLIQCLEEKKLDAVQPKVLIPNKQIQNIGFVMNVSIAKAKEISDVDELDLIKENKKWPAQKEFFGLSATCLLIKKQTFEKVGRFDERFHSYLEDIDLMIRLAKESYKYDVCIDAECIHEHMATSSKMGTYKSWQDLKNWMRIITKHYPTSMFLSNFFPLTIERLRNVNGVVKAYLQ